MKTSSSRFSECLYFASNALARKMEKMANENWKQIDLSPSHAYLLIIALDEPGVQPSALADQLQLQPSTITRLIEKLEEKKLLVRTTVGKLTNVYPTPKAKGLTPKIKQITKEFTEASLKLIGEKDSFLLLENMTKMADKL